MEQKALPFLIAGLISFLLSLGVMGQDKQKAAKPAGNWFEAETANYQFYCEDQKALEHYKKLMENLFKQYCRAFKYNKKPEKKFICRIYKNRNSYLAGGAPQMSGAYYSPETKELVWYHEGRGGEDTFNYVCHEGTHQFFDLIFPKMMDIPIWFNEGVSDCIGSAKVASDGNLRICDLGSSLAQGRLRTIKSAIGRGQNVSLKALAKMTQKEMYAQGNILYPQSWSFCYFLWNYPEKEGNKGEYGGILAKLIQAFKDGKSNEEAYEKAFGKDWEQKLDKLEKEWKTYVLNTLN